MATFARMGRDLVGGQVRLNLRFLARFFGVVAVLAATGYGLYAYQSSRLVTAYKDQAERARAEDKPAVELDYLKRYLLIEPNDAAARARSGTLLARLARRPQEVSAAYFELQTALRADPTLPAEVRLEAVKLAMRSGELVSDAKRELEVLRAADPENVEYGELLADCLVALKEYAAADKILSDVVTRDKSRIRAFGMQAVLRREYLKKPDLASDTIKAVVFANPKDPKAHVTASEHWKAIGQEAEYAKAVTTARQLDPTDADVVFAVVDLRMKTTQDAVRRGDVAEQNAAVDEVISLLGKLITDLAPSMPPVDAPPPERLSTAGRAREQSSQAYLMLVDLLLNVNRPGPALEWADRAVEAFPNGLLAKFNRARVLVANQKLDQAERALTELTRVRDSGAWGDLTRAGFPPAWVDLMRGQVLAQRKEWPAASRALETAALGLADRPGIAQKTNLLLARCYQETGELDRRYEAYRRAIPSDPTNPDWGVVVAGLADTLAQMGRTTEAAAEYRRLADRLPTARAAYIRLMLSEMARQPVNRRDWSSIEREIVKLPAGPEADQLRAEFLAAKGDLDAARVKFAAGTAEKPESARLWASRIQIELSNNKLPAARDVLAEAAKKLPDSGDLRLMRLAVVGASKPTIEDIKQVMDGIEAFPIEERQRVILAAANVATRLDRRDVARTWLDALAAEKPDDLAVQFARFDVAILDDDKAGMDDVVQKVVRTTGGEDTVPSRVARAFALLHGAKAGDPVLDQASELLTGLDRQRAGWGRIHLAQARVADLRGEGVLAAQKYRQAFDLGERAPQVLSRLFDLYVQNKQYVEADQLVQQLGGAANAGETGAGVAAALAIGAKNYERAAELAAKAVPLDSKDPERVLWLARTEQMAGRLPQAEKAYRRAIELTPNQPDAWVMLTQMLVRSNRPAAEVNAVVEAAEKAIPAAEAALPLAQLYLLAKRPADAQAQFDKLTDATDTPAKSLRTAAEFALWSGNMPKAAKLLDRLRKAPDKSSTDEQFANRVIAVLMAADPRPGAGEAALKLLGLSSVVQAATITPETSLDDIRTRAAVLAQMKGRRPRQAAVRLYEQLERRAPLATEDHYRLGMLYDALGDWPRARPHLEAAVDVPNVSRQYLVSHAFALLRNNDPETARKQVEKITVDAPKDPALAELRVRLAVGEGKPEAAVQVAREISVAAKRPDFGGALLEQTGLIAEAEPFFREAATTPQGKLALASYLARRDRLPESWRVLEAAWSELPIRSAVSVAAETALQAGANSPAVVAQIRDKVAAAAAQNPEFNVQLGALLSLTGDYIAAMNLGRQVLSQDPKNVITLNNMAYLTMLHEKRPEEALTLIRRAIEVAGPLPTLLDTEGLILIAAGRPLEAVEKLQEAVIDEPTAMVYFHLARAQFEAGQRLDARLSLSAAQQRNLRAADFHPLERATVADLIKRIESRS